MYQFLRTQLPELAANVLIVIWYVLLAVACLYGMGEQLGEFRYADW